MSDEAVVDSLGQLRSSYRLVREPRMQRVLRIQASLGTAIREYLNGEGFVELLPPIIGPVSDSGIRGAKQVVIDSYGRAYTLMSSAILYKQLMAAALGKIYFFSLNIRLEALETRSTGRHLVEFVQVDVEEAGASYLDAMRRAEGLVSHDHDYVKAHLWDEFAAFGRSLNGLHTPFRRLRYDEPLKNLPGHDCFVPHDVELPCKQEEFFSSLFPEPFVVYDYPRESRGFYDRENPKRAEILRGFDKWYPEGNGEATSGAERQFEYEKVVEPLRGTGENPSKYEWHLEMLQEGIPQSAGFGVGLERLTRCICGLRAVWAARQYRRSPESTPLRLTKARGHSSRFK